MKNKIYLLLLIAVAITAGMNKAYAIASVKITSSTIALADVNQGATSVIVYAAKMEVTVDPVTVNNITFTLSGTHDNNDLVTVTVYYNPNTPDLVGASYLNSTAATFAAPHTYSLSVNRTLAKDEDGYFVITVNISNTGTDNKTVQINGDTDPVIFGYTTVPTVDDQQSNKAKAQKIQAADLTITSNTISAADVNQGATSVIVYAAKMVDATEPVTVNNATFTLSGTHDNNDLVTVTIYYNPNTPDLVGASYLNSTAATFAAPHTYSLSVNRTLALGEDGYFVITVNISNTGTDNKTVQVNGDTDPVLFGYTTAPNVDDQQSNKAKAQKIQAADLTITSNTIAVADVNQGATSVIVYAAKMVDATEPVTVNSTTFTLSGTHDNNDLTTVTVYYNPNTPDLVGASYLNSTAATFAAPHTYTLSINRTLALGEDGYFVITVNISSTGTDNKTVQINGDTDPVLFGYTTAPNVDDQQGNKAKAQKIQAADLTITSNTIAVADVNQGATSVIVYAAKMVDATEPVTVNSTTFTLSGTHDNNDLTTVTVYYNPNTPDLVGASYLNSTAATFAAPHTYTLSINRTLALGEDGYFVITVNISSTGTDNKTVQINGDTDPVLFGYTTAPNVDDQQSNKAKAQKIQAADLTITSNTIAVADVNQGATSVIVYAAKMVDATEPVTVNSTTFTLSGTHDNNDLTTVTVYYNPNTPDLVGASYLNSTAATFAAPHTYTLSINRTLALGEDGYFVITVNISNTGTDNKTVQINGDTDPVLFGYTTAPNVDDQQSNKAKAQKIQAADLTLTTATIAASNILQGSTSNIVYAAKMVDATEPITVNGITFTLSGTHDNNDLTTVTVYYNPNTPDLVGASYLNSTAATFAGPHTYTLSINRTLALAEDGYFVVTVNVDANATLDKTVTINGSTDPVTFTYTTAPNVVNSQTNAAGKKTIKAGGPKLALDANEVVLNNIYPNPATATVNYSLTVNEEQEITMHLVDEQGRVMSVEKHNLNSGINHLEMNVSSLANGIYFLIASGDRGMNVTQRIVVQH